MSGRKRALAVRSCAAALLAVLPACAPKAAPGAPPAARAVPVAAAAAAPASDPCAALPGLAVERDPVAAEALVHACEVSAVSAAAPGPALLAAARGHRALAEVYAARAEGASGGSEGSEAAQPPHDLLARQADSARACAAAAHRALAALLPALTADLDAGRPPAEALAAAPAPAAEPLYLEAACSAAWARSQGFTHLVDRRAELQAALERAAALDPALDDAGPDRELGRLLSSLPTYAGGSLREARARFDAAVARAPGSVQNRVLYARGVAVKLQDRALFESLLNTALTQPAAETKERHEAEVARSLLARGNDLFGGAQ